MGIFGGTFDPFHSGHLHVLEAVVSTLALSVVRVIPAHVPPLRTQPHASAVHRVGMVRCALEHRLDMICDDREIMREGMSYTVETLESLRRDFPNDRLVLIVGRDAFDNLPLWHRWQDIPKLADIAVINRPGYPGHQEPPEWLGREGVHTQFDPKRSSRQIVFLEITPFDVSATVLRQRLATGEEVGNLVPAAVLSYIKANHLYV